MHNAIGTILRECGQMRIRSYNYNFGDVTRKENYLCVNKSLNIFILGLEIWIDRYHNVYSFRSQDGGAGRAADEHPGTSRIQRLRRRRVIRRNPLLRRQRRWRCASHPSVRERHERRAATRGKYTKVTAVFTLCSESCSGSFISKFGNWRCV